jgi:hypothetical protein
MLPILSKNEEHNFWFEIIDYRRPQFGELFVVFDSTKDTYGYYADKFQFQVLSSCLSKDWPNIVSGIEKVYGYLHLKNPKIHQAQVLNFRKRYIAKFILEPDTALYRKLWPRPERVLSRGASGNYLNKEFFPFHCYDNFYFSEQLLNHFAWRVEPIEKIRPKVGTIANAKAPQTKTDYNYLYTSPNFDNPTSILDLNYQIKQHFEPMYSTFLLDELNGLQTTPRISFCITHFCKDLFEIYRKAIERFNDKLLFIQTRTVIYQGSHDSDYYSLMYGKKIVPDLSKFWSIFREEEKNAKIKADSSPKQPPAAKTATKTNKKHRNPLLIRCEKAWSVEACKKCKHARYHHRILNQDNSCLNICSDYPNGQTICK